MNVYQIVNIVCLILGIAVLVFAALIAAGMIASVPTYKAPVPFLLGAVIVVWALISWRRHR